MMIAVHAVVRCLLWSVPLRSNYWNSACYFEIFIYQGTGWSWTQFVDVWCRSRISLFSEPSRSDIHFASEFAHFPVGTSFRGVVSCRLYRQTRAAVFTRFAVAGEKKNGFEPTMIRRAQHKSGALSHSAIVRSKAILITTMSQRETVDHD